MRWTPSRRLSSRPGTSWARGSRITQRISLAANVTPGRVVALDLGEVRTGVAISDPGGSLARPLEIVSSDRLTAYLRQLLSEEGVQEILVGIPKTLGGEVGFQARRVLDKLVALRDEFPEMRFVEWDERLTTRLARSSRRSRSDARSRDRRQRGAKERVDHLAAASMLQEYLDRRGTFEATRQDPS